MNLYCKCYYCVRATYFWEVDENTSWIEIPKNGSSTIKKLLKWNKTQIKNPLDYSKIKVVVRNPLDRISSLINEYFFENKDIKYRKAEQLVPKLLNKQQKQKWQNDKLSLVEDLVMNHQSIIIQNLYEPHHWNPQTSFYPTLDKDILDAKFEFLSINQLGSKKMNSTTSQHNFSEEFKEFIRYEYKEDYDIFERYIK